MMMMLNQQQNRGYIQGDALWQVQQGQPHQQFHQPQPQIQILLQQQPQRQEPPQHPDQQQQLLLHQQQLFGEVEQEELQLSGIRRQQPDEIPAAADLTVGVFSSDQSSNGTDGGNQQEYHDESPR